MGFMDFVKSLKLREWITFALFLVSLVVLIVGIVLIIVAANSIPVFPSFEIPTCPTNPKAVFTTSFASGVTWSENFENPNSDEFRMLASQLEANISSGWTTPVIPTYYYKALVTVYPPMLTQINAFSQAQNGVNFYTQFVFADGTVSTADVQSVITAQGYPTDTYTTSTAQCSGLVPKSDQPTVSPGTVAPGVSTTSSAVLQNGAYCDASQKLLVNIFLVDVSAPIIGTLDDKLAKISTYLSNSTLTINLDQNNGWTNQENRLVIYGGNEAIPLGRSRNQANWNSIISQLNSTIVNPLNVDSHDMQEGLRYVMDNYMPQTGVATNLIVVADGFGMNSASTVNEISDVLKNQYYYSIGIILMSTSQVVQSVVQPIASDFFHFYPIDSIDYLQNIAVQNTQALWGCQAFYPTAAPPTPAPTRIPLVTSVGPQTTTTPRPTLNPLLPTISGCTQNVLFLIDESQNLLSNGYSSAIQYAIKVATSLNNLNNQSRFAFIFYNQQVVYQSKTYTDFTTFANQINSAQQYLGVSNPTVGFNAASDFISAQSQYNNDTIRSVLFFITEESQFNNNEQAASQIAYSIRSKYQTQVVGVDLTGSSQSSSSIQQIVQYGIRDAYAPSVYISVTQPSDITSDQNVNSTIYQLKCKDLSNCNIDLTFVIETSDVQGDNYVDIQVRSVLNVLTYYLGLISPMKISVSVIYFSSPPNLTLGDSGNSGVLFQQFTNGQTAIDTLNTTSFKPYGAASDLQLGFQLTSQSLQNAFIQNSKFVVFFARGVYDKFANCCPDPSADAASVQAQATVQGVAIGPYYNKAQLDQLTASNSIDANQIIGSANISVQSVRSQIAGQISDQLTPIIDKFINSQYCPGVPDYINPPCEEPIDTLILLHANDQNNWNSIINFTANELIPDLLGTTGQPSSKVLTTSYPINFAIASYYYLDTKIFADFTYLRSAQDYIKLASTLPFYPTKGTATLSIAYKKAVEIFTDGRPYASKNLILITDTIDFADVENAFSEHDAMVQQVGGYTSALAVNTDTVPGADYQISVDPLELDGRNQYAGRQLANVLTTKTCTYKPVQIPTNPPTAPVPTLPGPIPVVKARTVWPDITILIDTSVASNSNDTGMDAVSFEKIRNFLDIFVGQYSIGEKGSKFTIATFDGQTVDYACKFIDVNNYYDLNTCRNEHLSFYSRNHGNSRDIAYALQNVNSNIYASNSSGYRGLNENFLILLTLGTSTTTLNSELKNIQRNGVKTIAIGLSNVMNNNDISQYGQYSFLISDWNSVYTGIDTNYDLVDRLIQTTTSKRLPSSTNFFGNLVFIVDQSQSVLFDFANIRQYVSDFVNQFSVDWHKTQISIIPFAANVLNPLALNAYQTTVDNYLTSWNINSVSTSNVANIGNAIQYAADMLASAKDRPNYVIYVVGSENATGAELSTKLLNNVEAVYVANYNLAAQSYAKQLAFDASKIYTVSSSSQLLNRVLPLDYYSSNPIVSLITDLYYDQQIVDSISFPVSSIAADIIILLDETGLTDDDFATMKTFLTNFTQLFHIDSTSTQFALQAYNGRTIPHDGFHLYESVSNENVKNRISQLTLAKATENSTDADLAGAIEQELFFFLTEANGWRDDTTTYTLIFSHADSFYQRDTATAQNVKNQSTVFAVGTNGQRFDYVRNFTNSGFYETVSSVAQISLNSPAIEDLLTTIQNDYKSTVYPTAYPIKSIVKADFIFLIDSALGTSYTNTIENFLFDFTNNVGTFSNSGNDTRLAFVTYGNNGPIFTSNLNDPQDATSIRNRIFNLNLTAMTGVSNLRGAIDSVILNEYTFGVDSTRPTYLTVISGSTSISPTIDNRTSRQLNTRYSTFVIEVVDNNDTFEYVPQVIGTKSTSNRVIYDKNLNFKDNQVATYTSWISKEFSAWQTTFPSTNNN